MLSQTNQYIFVSDVRRVSESHQIPTEDIWHSPGHFKLASTKEQNTQVLELYMTVNCFRNFVAQLQRPKCKAVS